ncbi:MAG: hypothetical protein H6586_06940 [Flavobacteriales bacterium]|nr:hypothetical protein [Flavobacteriales bacterium]
MKALLLNFFLLVMLTGNAQKQGNIWYFGENQGLDFSSGSPVSIAGGQMVGNPQQQGDYLYSEGGAVISDSSGSLLFYTNGEKVWNRNHQIMPNGSNLMGFYSSTHPAFIVPQPNSDSLFYIFTTDGLERYLEDGLRYSKVDMCLDNGNGDVILAEKNILLLDTVSEKLCAIPHSNGTDVWLIAHKFFSDAFYSYQITPTGITNIVITNIGSVHIGSLTYQNGCGGAIGQMKASPDGNRIGLVFSNVTPAVAELFNFNPSNGTLSNAISLNTENNVYGIEFSPDNSKLYITNTSGIHQFDLNAGGGTQSSINASKTNITSQFCFPSGMQLGPNGKIYVVRCFGNLGVINTPNNVGISCNFVDYSVPGTSNSKGSLPSFISGYNYSNTISTCDSTNSVVELSNSVEKELLKVVDLMGRETEDKPNTLLIYIYSDGTTEKVFRAE